MPKKFRTKGDWDGKQFVLLPFNVIDSKSYRALSVYARSLLVDIARQYSGTNNGMLLCSRMKLKTLGWNSQSTLHKAKKELVEFGFLYETFKGHRPNKASLYALTWYSLTKNPKFDEGAFETFERSAYARAEPLISASKNAKLSPPGGQQMNLTGPLHVHKAPTLIR